MNYWKQKSSPVEEDPVFIINTLRPAGVDDIRRKASIHRVRASVREEDPSAYDPQMVPIGPFHHGKSGMEGMENLKQRFMNDLLRRSADNMVKSYVRVVRAVAPQARAQYSADITLHDDAFVEGELSLANCNTTLLSRLTKGRS